MAVAAFSSVIAMTLLTVSDADLMFSNLYFCQI